MFIGVILLFISIIIAIFGCSSKGFVETLWVNIAIAGIFAIAGFLCLLFL